MLAEKLFCDLAFDNGVELKLGNIRRRDAVGGTMAGSSKIDEPESSQILERSFGEGRLSFLSKLALDLRQKGY